ncbi:MAG: HDOD domain-containing protein [Spartobacteria bacterium]|nr:HDOD domain-containing protein [Spartobacteria bacterium]
MSVVESIVSSIRRLPPLSDAGARLISMADKDSVSAGAMAQVISRDPTLAAQILRVANSAAFRRRERIESIQFAISLLGNRTVMGVVMGFCLSSYYAKPLRGYSAQEGALWSHSLCSAIAAQMVARLAIKDVSVDLAYTAGLLHGIGKAVLSEYIRQKDPSLGMRLRDVAGADFIKVEEEVLGTNHCEVGAALAEHWNLPRTLHDAIAFYHQPSLAPVDNRYLVYVVHLADFIALIKGRDTGVDGMMYSLDSEYDKYIHIENSAVLDHVIMDVDAEYKKLSEGFEMEAANG